MLAEKKTDSQTWSSYRKARLIALLLFFSSVPIAAVADFLQSRFRLPVFLPALVVAVLFAVIIVQSWRLALWPCPSCGKSFRGWSPFLPKRCWYCGYTR